MSVTASLALFGWIPAILLLFALISPTRAVLIGFLGAWMFLPKIGVSIPGLPDYTKATAATLGVLLATLLFNASRLASTRLSILDAPMAVWCLCPFMASMANGLGAYDGVSGVVENTLLWGLPYFLGRVYLQNAHSLKEAALWIFVGGLVYVPLCLFEVRMSPQLNRWVYGFGVASVAYAEELGKWGSRPRVFMGDALTLGMFMTAAALAGLWLRLAGGQRRLRGYPMGFLVGAVIVTAVACKNMGALVLLALGVATLLLIRHGWNLPVYAMIAAAPLYMTLRATGVMSGSHMVSLAGAIHERRAASLQTRLDNEDRLVDKAMQRPLFGWGRWGRARVYDETGKDVTLSDGLWVLALGENGLVGLAAVTASLLLPSIAFVRRYPPKTWPRPAVAAGGILAVLVAMYAIDCLFNAMLNPIYFLAMGGLTSNALHTHRCIMPARPNERLRTDVAPVTAARTCASPLEAPS